MVRSLGRRQFFRSLGLGAAWLMGRRSLVGYSSGILPDGSHASENSDPVPGKDSGWGGLPRQRNVLFVCIDDLNDWVGTFAGHPQAITPHIDRLAARGLSFTNAHCAAPVCNASRAATMTGVQPSRSGVYRNDQPWRYAMPNVLTLPQYFRQHGYQALGAGKIFHDIYPDPASWDEYHVSKCQQRSRSLLPPGPRPINGIGNLGSLDWGPVDVEDDAAGGDGQVARWIVDKIQSGLSEPFFLACGFYRPHTPLFAPRLYFDMYPLETIELPPVLENDLEDLPPDRSRTSRGKHLRLLQAGKWRDAVRAYLASLTFADAMFGRVLDALDQSGLAEHTLIVLWTDHGFHLGQKEHWGKNTLWEEATRVPLVVVDPEFTQPNTRSDRPVSLLDLYPTIVETCGLPPRDDLDGISLVPLFAYPEAPWDRVALTTHGYNNHAVRDQDWRYIRYSEGGEELYDHRSDPEEWYNLANDSRYADVKDRLARWLPDTNAPNSPSRDRLQREDYLDPQCVDVHIHNGA